MSVILYWILGIITIMLLLVSIFYTIWLQLRKKVSEPFEGEEAAKETDIKKTGVKIKTLDMLTTIGKNDDVHGEIGTFTIEGTLEEKYVARVQFSQPLKSPVVVAFTQDINPTDNKGQFIIARARQVSFDTCEIFLQNFYKSLGGPPPKKLTKPYKVTYMAFEPGRYVFKDGSIIEAGTVNTNKTTFIPSDAKEDTLPPLKNGEKIGYQSTFMKPPIVFSSVNTLNDPHPTASIIVGANKDNFQINTIQIREPKKIKNLEPVTERVGWISFKEGIFDSLQAFAFDDTEKLKAFIKSVLIKSDYKKEPKFLQGIMIPSEASNLLKDFKINLLMTKESKQIFFAKDTIYSPPLPKTSVGETGRVRLETTIDKNVSAMIRFKATYKDPIVVAYIATRNGGQSIDVRVRNVNTEGCEIFMQEPDREGHYPEEICFIVMEKGRYYFPNGSRIEAGNLPIKSIMYARQNGYGGEEVIFENGFETDPPVVLHTLNSHNNNAFMSSIAHTIT